MPSNGVAAGGLARVIAVDLDGTLVNSDLLIETVFLFLRRHPLRLFEMLWWLVRGKAGFKRRLADEVLPAVAELPYNAALLAWLEVCKAQGAMLVLATASDQRIANAVADHLGIFDEVMGTNEINLSAARKRAALVERFGEMHYEYVGNSSADLVVWGSAALIHVANPEWGVLAAARKRGTLGEIFDHRPEYTATLLRALRPHQWAKNILILVPLLASHRLLEWPLVASGLLAFVCFSACASSVYLLNDLFDLPDDRQHRTKRNRPLAAGALPLLDAVVLIPVLLAGAFALALWQLPLLFAGVLAGYYTLTLAYSLWLKRVVMLDVVVLAMLYTLRVIAGTVAMGLIVTFWILAFCVFLFLSLAFVKRYTELHDARQKGGEGKPPGGRGYYPADLELLTSLGSSSGYLSVLVLALYINEGAAGLYRSPERMWMACPLLLFWLSRVWLLAHRGQMHDDPVVFALRDRCSRWVGLGFLAAFALASF